MNRLFAAKWLFVLTLLPVMSGCGDQLSKFNENPNVVSPLTANPNLLLPTIATGLAMNYVNLGYGDIAGVVQHTQKDGWFSEHNHYDWSPKDWSPYYDLLRNNDFLLQRSKTLGYTFHQGVALTMKAFLFGLITDLWGDAPYTDALKGALPTDLLLPAFDKQQTICLGIIEDLKQASALFAGGKTTGYLNGYDVYYNGDPLKWQKFANSLLLRYYMRLSVKLPQVAKAGMEAVYQSGVYMKDPADDATMDYIGSTASNSWPGAIAFETDPSEFRRRKPCQTLLAKLTAYSDPRLKVWFAPVYVRWVADSTLNQPVDLYIRKNGVIQQGVTALTDAKYLIEVKAGAKFTRRFNPKAFKVALDTSTYVGLPPGLIDPSAYNYNPTTGQVVQNQHVSQLAEVYRNSNGGILKARLCSSAEVSFLLAEAALKGWAVGAAETHYRQGIRNSLAAWGVDGEFAGYMQRPGVAFTNTLEQVMTQKWIAGWTAATEAWFDYRRTGFPALKAGPAAAENVLPVRFIYGDNETNYNYANAMNALQSLEENSHTRVRGKNSQWSKPWIIQGTSLPW